MSCSSITQIVGYGFIILALIFGLVSWEFHFTFSAFQKMWTGMTPVLITGLLVKILMWDGQLCGNCKKD